MELQTSPLVVGGFNWGLHFRWDQLPVHVRDNPDVALKSCKTSPLVVDGLTGDYILMGPATCTCRDNPDVASNPVKLHHLRLTGDSLDGTSYCTVRDNPDVASNPVKYVIFNMELQTSPLVVGGFNWGLHFRWDQLPVHVRDNPDVASNPVKSPTMAGGLFAMDRSYYFELGEYDSGMDIWGGENLELSFRVNIWKGYLGWRELRTIFQGKYLDWISGVERT
ncbi:Hypothetical predicted protein [Mytilus galloprovincialis]|uniref:Uncharacterized protein n=1 Tax=Mytilus galloprovincialis TaxID=29158 RepID=A0A8B6DVU8_MYTGA|nr:Hypothetical predicted protein [Mytilus galloprovincialis]